MKVAEGKDITYLLVDTNIISFVSCLFFPSFSPYYVLSVLVHVCFAVHFPSFFYTALPASTCPAVGNAVVNGSRGD